jgi:hypothetical protein
MSGSAARTFRPIFTRSMGLLLPLAVVTLVLAAKLFGCVLQGFCPPESSPPPPPEL